MDMIFWVVPLVGSVAAVGTGLWVIQRINRGRSVDRRGDPS